jgi:hypothetical protein
MSLPHLEQVVANVSGQVRREKLDGRDYLVAPLTMIKPGVLNGSKGRLAYFLSDLQATYDAWNNMPIVVNHPHDEHGRSTSARQPHILEKYGIGTVFNSGVNGKLYAEGWFDIAKANKVDRRIIPAVESGNQLELSTGLGLNIVNEEGTLNGEAYDGVAREHKPDHLAILPDSKGACSIRDGCGVNNEDDEDWLENGGPG